MSEIPKYITSKEMFNLSHPELDQKAKRKKAQEDEFLNELSKLEPTQRTEEAEKLIWPFEILKSKEIKEQIDKQKAVGKAVGYYETLSSGKLGFKEKSKEYPFPSMETIYQYLTNDPEFVKLLKQKEKQGANKIIVAPYALSLETMINKVNSKVVSLGGKKCWRSGDWQEDNLNQLKYFTQLDKNDNITGGKTKAEVLANPQQYPFIVNGYSIIVTWPGDDLPNENDRVTAIEGRIPLKGGETSIEYRKKFTNSNPPYYGESSTIPEEWFVQFSQALYEKYILSNKQIESSGSDIFDTKSITWFIDCLNSSSGNLPGAGWDPDYCRFNLNVDHPTDSDGGLSPRPALRKKLEI